MPEKINPQFKKGGKENLSKEERFENLRKVFNEAEAVLKIKGREGIKLFLRIVYTSLIDLNKTKGQQNPLKKWNPAGDLTEAQFDDFNLRRKKLSHEPWSDKMRL